MNERAKVLIVMFLCCLGGFAIGLWVPQPLPKDVAGYYVRHRNGFSYVQVDRTGPMLPGISADEWASFRRTDDLATPAVRRGEDKAVPQSPTGVPQGPTGVPQGPTGR